MLSVIEIPVLLMCQEMLMQQKGSANTYLTILKWRHCTYYITTFLFIIRHFFSVVGCVTIFFKLRFSTNVKLQPLKWSCLVLFFCSLMCLKTCSSWTPLTFLRMFVSINLIDTDLTSSGEMRKALRNLSPSTLLFLHPLTGPSSWFSLKSYNSW